MTLSEEGRKAIQEANRYRNIRCGKCGQIGTDIRDGAEVGGMPGLSYQVCGACGWSRAITKHRRRPTKKELAEIFDRKPKT